MLKVAVAGCGLISTKNHIPALLKLKNKVKIAALCDLNESVAKEAANKFNIKTTYDDFSDMLLNEHPDIVDICTPPQTHAKLAIQAIENASHVLLEKPMALDLKDCDAMIEASLKHNKKICVMHNQIFNPAFSKAKELFSEGKIGDFLGMHILLSTPTDYMTSKEGHWAHRLPGGVLGETGPHAVYMALAFLKNVYDVEVFPRKFMLQYPWSSAEDFRIDLIASNGITSISLLYGSNQWAGGVDIIGTKGILKIDLQSKLVVKYNRPSLNPISVGGSISNMMLQTSRRLILNSFKHIIGRDYNAHTIGIHRFVDSILKGAAVPVGAEEGREIVRVMQMIVEKLNRHINAKKYLSYDLKKIRRPPI